MLAADLLVRASERHARFYLTQLEDADRLFHEDDIRQALARFDDHWSQVQTAFRGLADRLESASAASLCNAYVLSAFSLLAIRRPIDEHIVWLRAGIASAQMLGDAVSELSHWNRLGEAYLTGRTVDASRDCYDHALRLSRKIGNARQEADALVGLGRVNSLNPASVDTSRQQLRQAIDLYTQLDERRGRAWALLSLGSVEERYGDLTEAQAVLEQALALYRDLGDERRVATVLRRLGSVAERREDYDEAVRLLETALALARELHDTELMSSALLSLGLVRDLQGQPALARTLLEDALACCYQTGNKLNLSVVLINLGWVATGVGDFEGALAYHTQSVTLYRGMSHPRGLSAALLNQGLAQVKLGRLDEAEASLYEGFALLADFGLKDDFLDAMLLLSWLDLKRGDALACARMVGLVRANPPERGYPERDLYIEYLYPDLTAALPPDALDAALAGGAQQDYDASLAAALQRIRTHHRDAGRSAG